MTEQEQIKIMRLEILGDLQDDSKDEIFELKLNDAKMIALDTLYPFNKEIIDIPLKDERLKRWQVRCAIELYNKMGNTNVAEYSENGLSVVFMTGLISKELMCQLIPKAGVIK